MDGRRLFDGRATVHSESASVRPTTAHPSLQPNYSCRKVQEALEHLASIELIDLCNEAKVELCRATRDLRSCGRHVQSVLNSCGHASLCEECSQRCDACPICRFPIPKIGNRLRLRLYYECIEAGLISKRYDDRIQEKDGEKQSTADVERLCSFFDVALENNLLSLICHYIRDVCMDESAVSSDPVVALLLDELVVKDWCKRTFSNMISELEGIYNLTVDEIEERSSSLLKFTARLSCIFTVLEELESSFKDSLSAQLHDIHHLQESIMKTKQHTEMIIWYTRHRILEDLGRYKNIPLWRSDVRGRREAAKERAWPDPTATSRQNGPTLFIDDALSNLGVEQEYTPETGDALEIVCLSKDGGLTEGMVGCYPFENLRSAIDILFLRGSSDLVVAKQAILLYYLFDQLWEIPEEQWRYHIDDFAATFNISRQSILESFTFYLLDDQSDKALQEACRLLPEISCPTTHPKVAQVLLERQNPYAALMVFRWSGRDGAEVSLSEAVTAVRVRVECGLLVEAFMYQRSLCTKVKEKKSRHELYDDDFNEIKDDGESGVNWLKVLVTEICLLCIRRNLVDRIIALPWNADEEKQLHKCLLDHASENPSTGSLLVVFYLQRYRYREAYQVDCKLQSIEQDLISKNLVSEEVEIRMRSTSHWRAGLIEKSLQLLPEVEQQKVKSGEVTESIFPGSDINAPTKPDLPKAQNRTRTSFLVPSVNSSLLLRMGNEIPSSIPSVLESPSNFGGITYYGSPAVSQGKAFNDPERGMSMLKSISKHFKFDDITASATRPVWPVLTTPLKDFNRSSSRIQQNNFLQNDLLNSGSTEKEKKSPIDRFPSYSPYSHGITANPVDSPSSINGLFKSSIQDGFLKASGKSMSSSRLGRDVTMEASGDFMEMSWSNKEERVHEQTNQNDGPRWRSDDASDDDEPQILDRLTGGVATRNTPTRGFRRSRITRR